MSNDFDDNKLTILEENHERTSNARILCSNRSQAARRDVMG